MTSILVWSGLRTKFWLDRWLGECLLKERSPHLFKIATNKNTTVTDSWVAREGEGYWSLLFKRHFQDWEFRAVMQFIELSHKVRVLELREDSLLWREEKKGAFQVKSFCSSLHDENQALFPAKEIWGLVPLWECFFFFWRLHETRSWPLMLLWKDYGWWPIDAVFVKLIRNQQTSSFSIAK